jgi:hypothetical protein
MHLPATRATADQRQDMFDDFFDGTAELDHGLPFL